MVSSIATSIVGLAVMLALATAIFGLNFLSFGLLLIAVVIAYESGLVVPRSAGH